MPFLYPVFWFYSVHTGQLCNSWAGKMASTTRPTPHQGSISQISECFSNLGISVVCHAIFFKLHRIVDKLISHRVVSFIFRIDDKFWTYMTSSKSWHLAGLSAACEVAIVKRLIKRDIQIKFGYPYKSHLVHISLLISVSGFKTIGSFMSEIFRF